ncbi:MAG: protein phosphatase 2C domain-containing protein [Thermoguttaceae bacterium]|nr:protein phosphatase 2C domain-containing protein [Thermoguttaceae bacterium]MDW8080104.1 protein phosphatase 2C domain-containing protein [Thermoguttaceae bacterium]
MQLQAVGSHFGISFAAITHVGMRRGNNQDNVLAAPALTAEQWRKQGHLFVVADGMGAHAAGELASKLATDVVLQTYRKHPGPPQQALVEAIQEANRQIHLRGQADEEFRGMGTTVCALVLLPGRAVLANVGDSRIYRLRQGVLEQLTFDHSLLWELRAANSFGWGEDQLVGIPRNVITRSLGPHPEVKVDVYCLTDLQAGDTFVLCSDGLSGPVPDDQIGKVVALFPPAEAARLLVHLANYHGGPDNISVIVARVDKVEASPSGRTEKAKRLPIFAAALAAPSALLLAFLAAWVWFVHRTWWAFVALAGALVLGFLGVVPLLKAGRKRESLSEEGVLRVGPYQSAPASPDAPFAEALARALDDLLRRGMQEKWRVEWEKVQKFYDEGRQLWAQGLVTRAAKAYGEGFCRLMDQLFTPSSKQPS